MPTPTFRLDGAAAVVTGAAGGIGARIAIGLAEFGADVGCLDTAADGLDQTVAAIEKLGGRAVALIADVTDAGLSQVHYNSAKAGVLHLTTSLALEWAARGVRVNAVSPGYTATPMARHPDVWEHVQAYAKDIPLGRLAEPDELVGPTVFLLSDAASYCTGVNLLVDGGAVAW